MRIWYIKELRRKYLACFYCVASLYVQIVYKGAATQENI